MGKSIMNQLYIALIIAYKDLLEFYRRRIGLFVFIIMPLLMMAMFGYMFPSQSTYKHIPLAFVEEDRGSYADLVTREFWQQATSSGVFNVKMYATVNSATSQVIAGNVRGVVIIPRGFSKNIASGLQAHVILIVDPTSPTMAMMISENVNAIFERISNALAIKIIEDITQQENPVHIIKPITVEQKNLIAGLSATSTFEYMAPGFMAMTVMMSGLAGLAGAIARERETGTLDGLMVGPISRWSIILGKTTAQTVRGLLQGFLVLVLAMILFNVKIYGNIFLMIFILILGVAGFVGIGIIATSIAGEQESAMMLLMLMQLPMMFLSGILYPIEQLPVWMQWVAKAMPLTYTADALRRIMILNVGLAQIMPTVIILAVFAIITIAIAIPLFERAITR
jgi:ABC-2 type transport system permease protein